MKIHVDKYERIWIIMVSIVLGVFFASLVAGALVYGVRPAQPEGFINPMRLDETEFANPGVRHMGENRYEALIMSQAWRFETGEVDDTGLPVIRVPAGADVTFKMTSRDVIHGFMIEESNVNLEILPGQVGSARETFNEPGEFYFLCTQYCGRNHHGMYGKLIVEEATTEVAKD
jgi:cytochrome c oxidase subunit II